MDDDMLAVIKLFAGNFAPQGWFFCDGSLLPISQYQALYSLLGTTFGGDGRTTFGLPDLRGRVPVGAGVGQGLTPHNLGQKLGSETNTLTSANTGVTLVPGAVSGAGSQVAVASGQNTPVNNMQPSMALNYIICWQGMYPMRP